MTCRPNTWFMAMAGLLLAGLGSGCPDDPPPAPRATDDGTAARAGDPAPAETADPLAGLQAMPEQNLPAPVAATELDCSSPPKPAKVWKPLCSFADKARYAQHPEAARRLVAMGERVVPHLRRALRAGDPQLAEWAAKVCDDLGPEAAAALPELDWLLVQEGLEWMKAQAMALEALAEIGPAATPVLPTVLAALKRGPNAAGLELSGGRIAQALAVADKPYREVVAALLQLSKADDVVSRRQAVKALGRLRPEGEELVAALQPRLEDQDEKVRLFAAASLYKLGDHQDAALLERIAAGLRSEQPKTRQRAAWAVAEVGPAAEPLVESMIQGIAKEDQLMTRLAMLRSLGAVGRPADKVLPVLRKAAAKPGDVPARAAIDALADMGPAAEPALGLLRRIARKHKGTAKGLEASRAIRRIRAAP